MKRFRILIGLVASAGFATAAQGQDAQQTLENAQRFLGVLAEGDKLGIEEPHRAQKFIHYKITSITPEGACMSIAQGEVTEFTGGRSKAMTTEKIIQASAFGRRHGFRPSPFRIDWSSVTISQQLDPIQGSPYFLVTSPTGTFHIWLNVPDRALTKRLEYALQFLKEACDKTGGTGF